MNKNNFWGKTISVFVLIFSCVLVSSAQLTSHFQTWLNANGYSSYDFNRGGNSYGGRASASDTVVNQPVIFIHGNSDSALGQSSSLTGWNSSINYFGSQGYKTSELYATTWGDADPYLSAYQYHSKPNLQRINHYIAGQSNTFQTLNIKYSVDIWQFR